MNLSDCLSDCYRRLDFASSPATEVTTRLTAFLNETQREIISEAGLEQWLIGTTTFTSVADTPTYGVAPSIARILKIYEPVNRRTLGELSLDQYRVVQPDTSTPTGMPTHYVQLGTSPVSSQPSAASTLYVVSTSASDTNTAYLEGVRTGGYPFSTSIAMTGVTAVAFTVTDITEVTKFYLSAVAVGTVTLTDTP